MPIPYGFIINLIVTVVQEVPELVEKVLAIHRSSTMTDEEKKVAYDALRAEYKATVEKVKAAQL